MLTLETALLGAVTALSGVSVALWKRCLALEDRHAKTLDELSRRLLDEAAEDRTHDE